MKLRRERAMAPPKKGRQAMMRVGLVLALVALLPLTTVQGAQIARPECGDLTRAIARHDESAVKPLVDYIGRYVAQHYGDAARMAPLTAWGVVLGVNDICRDPANDVALLDWVADFVMQTNCQRGCQKY
jgi:hypothetical protein